MDNKHHNEEEKVARLLGVLAPGPVGRQETRRALHRFNSRLETGQGKGFNMLGLMMKKKVSRWVAGAAGVAALVGLLAIPQVQALASEFLSIFRVEKFVLVGVSEERMEQIQAAVGEGTQFGEHETISGGEEPQEAASLDEAASLAGFSPLQADASFGDPSGIMVSSTSVVRYRPDVAAIREVFSALNLDPEIIPANIDGQPFDITIPAGVMATYGKGNKVIAVSQVPSPTLSVPDGVDSQKLGEAMLQLLGMSADDAARMSQSIDWTSTLVVPVPQGLDSIREVTVRGTTALLYEGSGSPDKKNKKNAQGSSTVVWQSDGYLYSVTGNSTSQVLAFAEGLH
jgi:hypothetical protein